jgi:hypothetical protein
MGTPREMISVGLINVDDPIHKARITSTWIQSPVLHLPTQNLYDKSQFAIHRIAGRKTTHFSKTTPNTSSTSPLSPLPVILASISAAKRRCSAAVTISISPSMEANSLSEEGVDVGKGSPRGDRGIFVNSSFADVLRPMNLPNTMYHIGLSVHA